MVARKIVARLFKYPISYRYADAMKYWVHSEAKFDDTIPTIIPNWDHSPRSGAKGVILTGATPQLFRKHVEEIINLIKDKKKKNVLCLLNHGTNGERETIWNRIYNMEMDI